MTLKAIVEQAVEAYREMQAARLGNSVSFHVPLYGEAKLRGQYADPLESLLEVTNDIEKLTSAVNELEASSHNKIKFLANLIAICIRVQTGVQTQRAAIPAINELDKTVTEALNSSIIPLMMRNSDQIFARKFAALRQNALEFVKTSSKTDKELNEIVQAETIIKNSKEYLSNLNHNLTQAIVDYEQLTTAAEKMAQDKLANEMFLRESYEKLKKITENTSNPSEKTCLENLILAAKEKQLQQANIEKEQQQKIDELSQQIVSMDVLIREKISEEMKQNNRIANLMSEINQTKQRAEQRETELKSVLNEKQLEQPTRLINHSPLELQTAEVLTKQLEAEREKNRQLTLKLQFEQSNNQDLLITQEELRESNAYLSKAWEAASKELELKNHPMVKILVEYLFSERTFADRLRIYCDALDKKILLGGSGKAAHIKDKQIAQGYYEKYKNVYAELFKRPVAEEKSSSHSEPEILHLISEKGIDYIMSHMTSYNNQFKQQGIALEMNLASSVASGDAGLQEVRASNELNKARAAFFEEVAKRYSNIEGGINSKVVIQRQNLGKFIDFHINWLEDLARQEYDKALSQVKQPQLQTTNPNMSFNNSNLNSARNLVPNQLSQTLTLQRLK